MVIRAFSPSNSLPLGLPDAAAPSENGRRRRRQCRQHRIIERQPPIYHAGGRGTCIGCPHPTQPQPLMPSTEGRRCRRLSPDRGRTKGCGGRRGEEGSLAAFAQPGTSLMGTPNVPLCSAGPPDYYPPARLPFLLSALLAKTVDQFFGRRGLGGGRGLHTVRACAGVCVTAFPNINAPLTQYRQNFRPRPPGNLPTYATWSPPVRRRARAPR